MSKEFFFRNDDIRDSLDVSLIKIQDLFINNEVPIIHAVEPANVSADVVRWLLEKKVHYPGLVSLMQHGYDHRIKNNLKKGEFGGQRGYDEQFQDIKKGKELMDQHFGDQWFRAFNFPYAPYNKDAIRALQNVGYLVLNSHYNLEWKRQLFYKIGHFLKRGHLWNHHVSWNLDIYPGTSMYEISMNITFIKKYHNENTDCEFFTARELKDKIDRYIDSPYPIGLLLHHRYHVTESSLKLIEEIFSYLIDEKKCAPVSMEYIYSNLVNA